MPPAATPCTTRASSLASSIWLLLASAKTITSLLVLALPNAKLRLVLLKVPLSCSRWAGWPPVKSSTSWPAVNWVTRSKPVMLPDAIVTELPLSLTVSMAVSLLVTPLVVVAPRAMVSMPPLPSTVSWPMPASPACRSPPPPEIPSHSPATAYLDAVGVVGGVTAGRGCWRCLRRPAVCRCRCRRSGCHCLRRRPTRSTPAPPLRLSLPRPPSRVSLARPPRRSSSALAGQAVDCLRRLAVLSRPSPPSNVSLPPSPRKLSLPKPPETLSSPVLLAPRLLLPALPCRVKASV